MRRSARLCAFLASLCALPAMAATVDNLYQVREQVSSQQPEERQAALGRAVETLVLRLTGNPKVVESAALEGVRKDPQQWVSQYVYEGDQLRVDFDPLTAENALRRAGVPTWGVNRPLILAWWLNTSATGNSLVGDGQEAAAPLQAAAQHRGLPLRLPLADLQEQLVATPQALTADQADALREPSARYDADALLAVDAQEQDGQWQAQWRLWLGDAREQGSAQGADQAALADAVLLAVSERLAPRYLVKPGATGVMTVEVQGVDLARYAEINRLMEPFAATLLRVDGRSQVWRVNASSEQLRSQLGLAGLRELPADAVPLQGEGSEQPQAAPAPGSTMRFGW